MHLSRAISRQPSRRWGVRSVCGEVTSQCLPSVFRRRHAVPLAWQVERTEKRGISTVPPQGSNASR
eukprot:4579875-Pyramimonas_sp.AAC.1